MTTAYPLSWPEMFPRTKIREASQFRTSLAGALANVRTSLEAFGKNSGKKVTDLVLSSNVALGEQSPADPGVAVWFQWDGLQVCIPCDRYRKPEENLQAIHHVIEARRTELRHGTLAIVRATMTGFAALPPPPRWSDVLGFKVGDVVDKARIETAFKRLAKTAHPDTGGSADKMAELNRARETALKEMGS